MTVSELIKTIEQYPDDMEVLMEVAPNEGLCARIWHMKLHSCGEYALLLPYYGHTEVKESADDPIQI